MTGTASLGKDVIHCVVKFGGSGCPELGFGEQNPDRRPL
jgi:hypothetical protein